MFYKWSLNIEIFQFSLLMVTVIAVIREHILLIHLETTTWNNEVETAVEV